MTLARTPRVQQHRLGRSVPKPHHTGSNIMKAWGIAVLRGGISVIALMVAFRLAEATEWSWFAWFAALSLAGMVVEILLRRLLRPHK
ncbi:hypothetical protein ACR03S_07315 [Limimaricola variabilis]